MIFDGKRIYLIIRVLKLTGTFSMNFFLTSTMDLGRQSNIFEKMFVVYNLIQKIDAQSVLTDYLFFWVTRKRVCSCQRVLLLLCNQR